MKAFKGFNKDMTCTPNGKKFQYEEGKSYHEDQAVCCDTGFHACEYPLDCFGYYNPAQSVYHEVELSGDMSKKNDDSKVCATDIKIGAKISIAGMVKAAIDFTMSRVKKEAAADENYGASSATGYKGASSATGSCGASSATGDYGASSATGDYGASSATGSCGASSATGYKGASSAEHETAVAVAWGYEAKAKGCIGSHLILSDWEYTGERYSNGEPVRYFDKDLWILKGAKLVVVDGETIKPDTFYRCINGEVVEVD